MSILVHTHDGAALTLEPNPGDTLAHTIFLSGIWHDVALCSGLGKCGLCKVRYISDAPAPNRDELKKLGQDALNTGWRLACLHSSETCEIEVPKPIRSQRMLRLRGTDVGDYTLAVDLGTTSIHSSILINGKQKAATQELNPQAGMGSEVMSRLAAASTVEGRATLKSLVKKQLVDLCKATAINVHGKCMGLAVSGNPAMIYLLLGMKPEDIATAPYELSYTGGTDEFIAPSLPPAYIPPLLAPFVGADISAGLTAIEYGGQSKYPFLLADLGTNGEFILALSPEKRLCASVPMGPALEGVGLSFGRTAGPGTITSFGLTPSGLVPHNFEGTTDEPTGMTGTGYLSLVSILRTHGVLDESGHFGQGNTPLAAKLAHNVTTITDEPAFRLNNGLYLPASDIEEIMKVKAAFNLAMSALLEEAGITPSQLTAIHIAGALGEHVSLNDLEVLGFLPPGTRTKAVKAGNTSLKGTELILTDPGARAFVETLPDTITALDLTEDETFGDRYLARMRFTYVD
ncbi:ASKHA domain-containing protein [uncultured Pseudodesulfovibrio sp.]|uniref:ASKHA domain-containing protein n=1 Tax=uncultured Pseudodesulfovibrio sp. TaxID=2035858 RepID=UPI0029C7A5D9|nr:ASKHA domain-containing protein [uncultured Pseudodesulfovibrio sp.]